MKLTRLLFLPALIAAIQCSAQITLPVPVYLQATYIKSTRTIAGAPGKNYWQNSAGYTIKINFNPQTRYLNGDVSIDYTNNSPDTLTTVNFKLYPNLFRKGSIHNMPILTEDVGDE